MLTTPKIVPDEEATLSVRAAWLHYAGGLTQGEVAKRLGITSLKAHRLISRANKNGLIRISIDGDIAECIQLEDRICQRYGLSSCEVAPDLEEGALPLHSLGLAGSRFLRVSIESGEHSVIGVGHGRTLAACAGMLPHVQAPEVKLVSLLGGLTRRYAATPFDVIHRLAERTGSQAYVLPVPFCANSVEDKAVLMSQRGVSEIVDLGISATLRLVSIGTMEGDASILSTGMIEPEEFEGVRRSGAVAELLGHFVDPAGRIVESEVSARTLSMSVPDIRRQRTVAVAGGRSKIEAMRAVLESGLISGLITDERTASALVA